MGWRGDDAEVRRGLGEGLNMSVNFGGGITEKERADRGAARRVEAMGWSSHAGKRDLWMV